VGIEFYQPRPQPFLPENTLMAQIFSTIMTRVSCKGQICENERATVASGILQKCGSGVYCSGAGNKISRLSAQSTLERGRNKAQKDYQSTVAPRRPIYPTQDLPPYSQIKKPRPVFPPRRVFCMISSPRVSAASRHITAQHDKNKKNQEVTSKCPCS